MEILSIVGWVVAAAVGWVAWGLRERVFKLEAELRAAEAGRQAADSERQAVLERTRAAIAEADASVRRTREESDRSRPFAAEPVLKDVLEVIDNLDRAIAAGEGGRGVAMIHRQSLDLLRRHGVERLASLDQIVDPAVHEAIATQPAAGPVGRVIAEISAGYRLHGRLLRAARVVVTVEEEPADNAQTEEEPRRENGTAEPAEMVEPPEGGPVFGGETDEGVEEERRE